MAEELKRRNLLGDAIAGATVLQAREFAQSNPQQTVIPWSDQPPPVPPPLANAVKTLTRWEDLDSWITANNKFFSIAHYERPAIDEKAWRLDVAGMVAKPLTLTLDDLKALPRQEITSTIECFGNSGLPFLPNGIGNARWAETSLAETLRTAQIKNGALEVVFYGVDQGGDTQRRTA